MGVGLTRVVVESVGQREVTVVVGVGLSTVMVKSDIGS